MPKIIDLIGQKFGRLIVIQRINNNKWGQSRWLCQCKCKQTKIVAGNNLRNGHTKSCGCLQKEKVTKHGHNTATETSLTYKSWYGMKQRCTNINDKHYHDYGGREIAVCEKWLEFSDFLKDMGKRPTKNHSIDRIKNNKGYYKKNCRWATKKEQMLNRRNNCYETYEGKTQLVIELAEEYNVPYHTLWERLYRLGWSIEKALTTPIQKRKTKGTKNV